MPGQRIERLQRWARGEFYPLSPEELGRNALDELYDEMKLESRSWWVALKTILDEADRAATENLVMPFAALLEAGGESLRAEVAEAARRDLRLRNPFWEAMEFAQRPAEAYRMFGRSITVEAFARHQARIPIAPSHTWPNVGDEWSGDALIYLVQNEPDEAWTIALDLLTISVPPSCVGAFIIEDLLHDHGDEFVERIESEAANNERLRMALPTTRWMVPEHLMARVAAAAGPYWNKRS